MSEHVRTRTDLNELLAHLHAHGFLEIGKDYHGRDGNGFTHRGYDLAMCIIATTQGLAKINKNDLVVNAGEVLKEFLEALEWDIASDA